MPDGSKSVSSFGSNCTTQVSLLCYKSTVYLRVQDLFDYLFSSELLSSTEVLIRSIDPSFEVIDSESDSIALSSIPNLGKSFRLFVEYL